MKTKVCSKCKKEKVMNEFPKNSNSKTGRDAYCRLCRKELNDRYNPIHNPRRSKLYLARSTASIRARRVGVANTLTLEELKAAWDLFDGKCHCGCGADAEDLDHIIPFGLLGPNVAENVWFLSKQCHIKKSIQDRANIKAAKESS